MNLLLIISLAVLLAYILRILSYRAGWQRVVRKQDLPGDHRKPENRESLPAVTLVVPLRNEERNIRSLLGDLAASGSFTWALRKKARRPPWKRAYAPRRTRLS